MDLIFILCVILLAVILMTYVRGLSDVVGYSKEHGVDVFGRNYRNVYSLYSDVWFLNKLFSGKDIDNCQNAGLKERLRKSRKLLLLQLMVGLIVFISIIVNALLKI
jgi:hypothetical protein